MGDVVGIRSRAGRIASDVAASARRMRDVIWPEIGDALGGGRLIVTEGDRSPLAEALDFYAGTDALAVHPEEGVRMLGLRTSVNRGGVQEFTLRKSSGNGPSEWEKAARVVATPDRFAFAHVTVFADVLADDDGESLHSAAWVNTADLVRHIASHLTRRRGRRGVREFAMKSDGARFWAVRVSALKASGVRVTEWVGSGANKLAGAELAASLVRDSGMTAEEVLDAWKANGAAVFAALNGYRDDAC